MPRCFFPAYREAAEALRRMGTFSDEPELHVGADVLVPDLAGWRRVRMPLIPDTAFFALAPDWVCEVVSPKTGRLDRLKKLPGHARAGNGHIWLVDPRQRTLEVLRLDGGHWTIVGTHGDDDHVGAEPFEAVAVELSALWTDVASE